jgi:hypothetical protein
MHADDRAFERMPVDVATWGLSPRAFVVAMGNGQGYDDIQSYADLAIAFLDRHVPRCAGRAHEAWEAAKRLMRERDVAALYAVFGLRFIRTDAGGNNIHGPLHRAANVLTRGRIRAPGEAALERAMIHPEGKDVRGVLGFSLGAQAVASYFRRHATDRSPFRMEAAFPSLACRAARRRSNYAGGWELRPHDHSRGPGATDAWNALDAAWARGAPSRVLASAGAIAAS